MVLLYAVLHKALAQAVKWGLILCNPADAVERPKVRRKEFRVLSPEEALRFLEAAEEDRLHAFYILAITCGLRLGELLGLKWEDIDLGRGTLTVRRQLQWVTVDGKQRPVFSEPKSAKSRAAPSPYLLRRLRPSDATGRGRQKNACATLGSGRTTDWSSAPR